MPQLSISNGNNGTKDQLISIFMTTITDTTRPCNYLYYAKLSYHGNPSAQRTSRAQG